MISKFFRVIGPVAIAVLLLWIVFRLAPFGKVVDLYTRLGIRDLLLLVGSAYLVILVKVVRIWFSLKVNGFRLPVFQLHYVLVLSFLAGFLTPGYVGSAVMMPFLRRYSVPYSVSAACFLSDRLFDLWGLLLFICLFMAVFVDAASGVLFGIMLILATMLALFGARRVLSGLRGRERKKSLLGSTKVFLEKSLTALATVRRVIHVPILLTILSYGFYTINIVIAYSAVNGDDPLVLTAYYYISSLVVVLPVALWGAGARELILTQLVSSESGTLSLAVAGSLLATASGLVALLMPLTIHAIWHLLVMFRANRP